MSTETWALVLAGSACAIAVAAMVSSTKRHRRLAKRLERTERRSSRVRVEMLPMLRPLWAEYARSRLGATGALTPTPRAEHGEDMVLLALFTRGLENPAKGFFVEAGGYDGRKHSATWIFEAIGWRGVLVEPVPVFAERAKGHRPGSVVVQAALGPRGVRDEVKMMLYPEDGGHERDLWAHVEGSKIGVWRPDGRRAERIAVPRRSLADILKEHAQGVERVDLFVLDVEGSEAEALDGLELETHRPRVVVLEDTGADGRPARALEDAGYIEVTRQEYNRIYIHRDESALLETAFDLLALDQTKV